MGDRYVVNVEGAAYRDGSYLLARRSESEDHAAGTWSLVGGTVEGLPGGEDVLFETLRREFREEVGLAVADPHYVTSGAFVADDGDPVVNVVCLCAHERGEATVEDPEEVAEVAWVPADDLPRSDLEPFTVRHLEAVDELRRSLGW